MSEPTNPGHRQRLRDRFLNGEEGSCSDETLLELLLTYAIPQKDVRPLAKQLLAAYGDLISVLSASVEDLCRIKGIKANSAALIKLVGWIRCNIGLKPVSKAGSKKTAQLSLFDLDQAKTHEQPSAEKTEKSAPSSKTQDNDPFPKSVNVNRGILEAIPHDEFKRLAEDEAKRPEPTAAHVGRAFERYLRANLNRAKFLILGNQGIILWAKSKRG